VLGTNRPARKLSITKFKIGEFMSLQIGDVAPDFELKSHAGGMVKLSDFRGKKNVFIAFYPLDWTPV
jgi:peroxiredoxin